MEIDLNKECVNGGECEKGEENGGCVNGCLSTSTSSFSSNADPSSLSAAAPSIYVELWHACGGPLTCLPKKGNVVVYFPQGHMEQANSTSRYPPVEMPTFDLPPQIFCRVVDVQLLANKENDEVYTQLSLLPLPELSIVKLDGKESEKADVDDDDDGNGVLPAKSTSHMFCKTLTASDTSTHGGFSVPRRAAEDCFPPLDYKEERPSQELTAKDLHGVEWKFRHIYRGQPRRHLLTTGWSIFVSQKNLVSGDAVLFLRGEAGELHLGIRRAARPRNGLPDSVIKNQNSYPSILSPVANALSTSVSFTVFYSPRASHHDFIIPYKKYVKCTTAEITVGTRFRMRLDSDDSPERRFSGMVTGVGDMDPYRWRNSKWRCLMVRWDDDIMSDHQERVSPWDIDFSGNYAPVSIQSSPRLKKLRTNLLMTPRSYPIAVLDFEESGRSSKVLQGQEKGGLASPVSRGDRVNRQLNFEVQPAAPNHILKHAPTNFTGFVESNWFPQVLQGQGICSFKSLAGKFAHYNVHNTHQTSITPSFYPLALEGTRNMPVPHKGIHTVGQVPLMLSNFSNFQTGNPVLNPAPILSGTKADIFRLSHIANEPKASEKTSAPNATSMMHLNNMNGDNDLREKVPICKIFGFSLTENPSSLNLQCPSKRSCTKVHKQGSLVRRAIDLSRLRGYDELLNELERLFSMEGLLLNPSNGWRILYTDSANDVTLVGDNPWHEFVEVATKIHIYTQEEVKKLSIGMNNDETKSCLEEAPPAPDVPKSSSVGTPDSSPTVIMI